MVCLVYIFIFQTNDNDNEHLVEFEMSYGITEAKNMQQLYQFLNIIA